MTGLLAVAVTWAIQSVNPAIASSNSTTSQSFTFPNQVDNQIVRLPQDIDLFKKLGTNHSATVTFNPEQDYEKISILFSKISLPAGAYLQIIPSRTEKPITYNYPEFYNRTGNGSFESDPVPAGGVTVRLVYPKGHKAPFNGKADIIGYRLIKDPARAAQTNMRTGTVGSIIGQNQMKQAVCYQEINPSFYQRSLAVATANGGDGTGWNIAGDGPYMMTNHHVAGDVGPKRHSLTYNYESPTCNPAADSQNSLTIKTESVIASGGGGNENDWSIYKVDELAWQEAGIVPLFGNLWMDTSHSTSSQLNKLPLFLPQHPWGAVKRITHLHDDGNSCAVTKVNTDNQGQPLSLAYNCDTDGGSSGSPVLSQQSYGVIAEHYAGATSYNIGIDISHIYRSIAPTFPDANRQDKSILGKGKVLVFNSTIVPYMPAEISLNLQQSLDLKALDDSRLVNYGTYYLFKAKGRGSDGEIKTVNARLSPSNDKSAGVQKITISVLSEDNPGLTPELLSGWMAFYVNDYNGGGNLANLVVPFTFDEYDPFVSPFSPDTQVPAYTVTAEQQATSDQIQPVASNFGFTAVRTGQGPMTLVTNSTGYSALKVQVKDENGRVDIIKLRGQRKTTCSPNLRQMNDYTGCGSSPKPATLIVTYQNDDNPDLPKGHRYQGIFPVQTQRDTVSEPMLINIDVKI